MKEKDTAGVFTVSSTSVYYTERKLKNKKRGRPGNETMIATCFRFLINLFTNFSARACNMFTHLKLR